MVRAEAWILTLAYIFFRSGGSHAGGGYELVPGVSSESMRQYLVSWPYLSTGDLRLPGGSFCGADALGYGLGFVASRYGGNRWSSRLESQSLKVVLRWASGC
ncbi:hypothetical protein U1Q18_016792 [Sarracenia purpurea var. burkii]